MKATMSIADAYRDDLAYIHDVGHGALARAAAGKLVEELAGVGCRAGTVVDLGCGSGILARALIEAGYHVVGTDVSEAMVALARTHAPRAEFRVGSFVSADLQVSVAVTAIGEVLNYAFDSANDDRARTELFQRAYEALVPGGVLLFDISGPERARPGGPHRTFAAGPDWAVLAETNVEAATNVLTRHITSFRQVGALYRRDAEVHRLALLDPTTVLESLRTIGFEVQILPGYGAVSLPPGMVAFLGRKPLANAVAHMDLKARLKAGE
jgi:SAM-dependent methyltransferase